MDDEYLNKSLRVKEKLYHSSDKIRYASHWQYFAQEIMQSAVSGKPLSIDQRMESHENHNVVLEHVMKLFAKGQKLSSQTVQGELINENKGRLENKDDVH